MTLYDKMLEQYPADDRNAKYEVLENARLDIPQLEKPC